MSVTTQNCFTAPCPISIIFAQGILGIVPIPCFWSGKKKGEGGSIPLHAWKSGYSRNGLIYDSMSSLTEILVQVSFEERGPFPLKIFKGKVRRGAPLLKWNTLVLIYIWWWLDKRTLMHFLMIKTDGRLFLNKVPMLWVSMFLVTKHTKKPLGVRWSSGGDEVWEIEVLYGPIGWRKRKSTLGST